MVSLLAKTRNEHFFISVELDLGKHYLRTVSSDRLTSLYQHV